MQKEFQLTFHKHLSTKNVISDVHPNLTPVETEQYAKILGARLFLFKIEDQYVPWTILKTEADTVHFLDQYNKQFGLKLSTGDLEPGYEFDRLQSIRMAMSKSEFKSFLELDHIELFSLKQIQGEKRKEEKSWFQCTFCCDEFEHKTVMLTDQGIVFLEKEKITDFLLFDAYFSYVLGTYDTGYEFGIQMTSVHRQVLIKAKNVKDFITFLFYLKATIRRLKQKEVKFQASSFKRSYNQVQLIVDAEDHFRKVAHALEKAQKCVFMAGWWISPELPLIRPYTTENQKYRLDNLLKSIARKGVQIFVLVFENPPVVPNDSQYTQEALEGLHHNIKVLTHPSGIIPAFWSHHEKIVVIDQKVAFIGGVDLCYGRYDNHQHTISSNSPQMYPGIQYNNNRIKDFNDVHNYKVDGLPRNQPRMPWHDISSMVVGRVVADISHHFIEYWYHAAYESMACQEENFQSEVKKKVNQQGQYSKIVPMKNKLNIIENRQGTLQQRSVLNKMIKNFEKNKKSEKPKKFYEECLNLSIESLLLMKVKREAWQKMKSQFEDECQLLRSASEWSIGLEEGITERSIQNAYIELIQNAQHYIFIENQFFISATGDKQSFVSNQIANEMVKRIKKAIDKKENFKIIVFMPLLPGMVGDFNDNPPMPLQLIVHWQYQTISRGQQSLFGRLKKMTPTPEKYLQFYGLRQHGLLEGKPVTELLYIHSKLMIVDDKYAIYGSANVNDRSQEGDRDSQLCIFISKGREIPGRMGGKQCMFNQKVHQLRVKLYQEHFDFTEKQSFDPLDEKLTESIRLRTRVNTQTYRNLFGCYPDDNIKDLKQGKKFMKEPTKEEYEKFSKSIMGHAVEFPLSYLENEDLSGLDLSMVNNVMI